MMKHIRCAVDSILPDAHSDAYISVNTETPKLARPSMWCAMKGLDYTHRHIRMHTRIRVGGIHFFQYRLTSHYNTSVLLNTDE